MGERLEEGVGLAVRWRVYGCMDGWGAGVDGREWGRGLMWRVRWWLRVCSPMLSALHLGIGRLGGCSEARAGVFDWGWGSALLFADVLVFV